MRLGILGGTFNPIHVGHLILAECAREAYALDQVWFMPSATPPHKAARALVSGAQRLRLIRLAIRGHPAFRASDLEFKLGGVSYTIRTVLALKQQHPKARLFFIMGSDMLGVRWSRMAELRRLCTFVVAKRPGQGRSRLPPGMRRLLIPQIALSSSLIRKRIRAGLSVRYLIPHAVACDIARHRLYQIIT